MTKLTDQSIQLKKDMRKDYLNGMSLLDIASKYNFKSIRTVYFHLKGLTKEEKVLHLQKRLDK